MSCTLVYFQSSSMKAGFNNVLICVLIVVSIIFIVLPFCHGVPIVGGRVVSSKGSIHLQKCLYRNLTEVRPYYRYSSVSLYGFIAGYFLQAQR